MPRQLPVPQRQPDRWQTEDVVVAIAVIVVLMAFGYALAKAGVR